MNQSKGRTSRRSFLRKGLAVGGAGAVGAGLLNAGLLTPRLAFAREMQGSLPQGDIDILTFLAAIETVEADLWQQYNELGGIQDAEVPGGSGSPGYIAALQVLDGDMPQYIHDNTDDEFSHMNFLNAFLVSVGEPPVDLTKFATLPSSKATGAQQIGRLTNLMQLTVDTSWWTRYRSSTLNPDIDNPMFPQAIPGLAQGQFTAIPRNDDDVQGFKPVKKPKIPDHLQAIANTAGFHFGFIEQGGTSLYPTLAQGVTDLTVLRILLSIGPTETMHFQTWQDKAGNAPPLTDPTNGLVFPNLNAPPFDTEQFQTNLIMPEPTIFLKEMGLPKVSIIRPTLQGRTGSGGAVATVNSFTADGLFIGNDPLVAFLMPLAQKADDARRGGV